MTLFASWDDLANFNTRRILWCATLLGAASGAIGTLLYLRKRTLTADVFSHAGLPGIAVSFLLMERFWPGSGKSVPTLLLGAGITGLAALALLDRLARHSRVREDAALAIVLGLFFGLGTMLLSIIQGLPEGSSAGLGQFVLGQAAGITHQDAQWITGLSTIVLLATALVWKELKLVCFDPSYAAAEGWPVPWLDRLLLVLALLMTVVGMQSVGLLLVVGLLAIPPAAARFWTNCAGEMALLSVVMGGLGSALGVIFSSWSTTVPTGSAIILAVCVLFFGSLLFGREKGLAWRGWRRYRASIRRENDDLLRTCFEIVEQSMKVLGTTPTDEPFSISRLLQERSWSLKQLKRLLHRAVQSGWLRADTQGNYRFTSSGAVQGEAAVRRHRLWELYLLNHAQIDERFIDSNADEMEHILEPEVEAELQRLLVPGAYTMLPTSPHPLSETSGSGGGST